MTEVPQYHRTREELQMEIDADMQALVDEREADKAQWEREFNEDLLMALNITDDLPQG